MTTQEIITLACKDALVQLHRFDLLKWDSTTWLSAMRGMRMDWERLSIGEKSKIIMRYQS